MGPPLQGTECRLIDPATGADAAPGEPGEVWVRGPQVMRGYLNNPEATAAVIDSEGWLRTGDLAIAGQDGWLTVVDRVKELKAFAVPAGDDFDADAVLTFVAEQVAPYKRIRIIDRVPEIPKSPSGKILRRLLRSSEPVS